MKGIVWLGLVVATQAAFGQRVFPQGPRHMPQDNRPPRPAPIAPRFSAGPRPVRPFSPIYPLGFGGYGYDYSYAQQPSLVIIEPPPPPMFYPPVPERPPETATLVVHEYRPAAAATQPPDADQPVFAIVLKNGTTLSATAVVAQNDGLHIVDSDGDHQRVSMDAVDREATKRVNRERRLLLQLPPGR